MLPSEVGPAGATSRPEVVGQENDSSGGGGVGRCCLRPGGQQCQNQPWGGNRDLGAVDGPGLARLELASGAHVLTQHLRQGAQQRPQVGAAYLVGQAQGLNDPVGDRVGEAGLEPVQGAVEAGGGGIVGGEGPELGADGLRAALTEVGQRLRQAHAGTDAGDEGVDGLGPYLAQPGATVARPRGDDEEGDGREDGTEGESHRPGSGHSQEDQADEQPQPDRAQDEHGGTGTAGAGLDQDVGQETGASRAPLRRLGGAGHPDQEQPHPAQEPGDGTHQKASWALVGRALSRVVRS